MKKIICLLLLSFLLSGCNYKTLTNEKLFISKENIAFNLKEAPLKLRISDINFKYKNYEKPFTEFLELINNILDASTFYKGEALSGFLVPWTGILFDDYYFCLTMSRNKIYDELGGECYFYLIETNLYNVDATFSKADPLYGSFIDQKLFDKYNSSFNSLLNELKDDSYLSTVLYPHSFEEMKNMQ